MFPETHSPILPRLTYTDNKSRGVSLVFPRVLMEPGPKAPG